MMADADRTYTIGAENRVWVIEAEERTITITENGTTS
jgi:hypothetical protein